jgi:Arylsulfotransferase (ASST)
MPALVFVISLMFWSFVYGIAVYKLRIFPFRFIREAVKGAEEVRAVITGRSNWYHDTDRTERVVMHRPNAFAKGLTLVSGLTKEGNVEAKVITPEGTTVHRWYIDWFDEFWPDPQHIPARFIPRRRPATHIHGMALLQNGDLVFNLENLGLTRMDLCGKVLWRLPYQTHHAIHVDEAGTIWVAGLKMMYKPMLNLPNYQPPFWLYTVLRVAPDGEIMHEISIPDLLIKNGLQGLLYMSATDNQSTEVNGDTLHLNDVEIFPSYLQPGIFKKGDVMVSLRNIHAVLVFDPDTLKIKHLNMGHVVRQHDPDFIDGNRISIFDNNNVAPESQGPHSRIVVLSAANDDVQVIYSGSDKQPFYTDIMGKHEWLPNGNILITESTKGRAFEINREGELVWEYFNLIDKGRVASIDEAQRLPSLFTRSFFEEGCRACDKSQPLVGSIGR